MWSLLLVAVCLFLQPDESQSTLERAGPHPRPKPPILCREDEEFLDCGCLKTCCNGGKNEDCAAQCTRGCFCKGDLVRDDQGKCVELKDCKGGNTNVCGKNEVYKKCGTACPVTCSNRNKPPKCKRKLCVKGCFCKDGYVRDHKGKCIKECKCPTDVCGVNEVYKDCGTACPKTCSNRNYAIKCTAHCVKGCFCKEGYVRDDDGDCVKPEKCPTECPDGEVYSECGSACPHTCDNKDSLPCLLPCVAGCFCPKGFVRNGDGRCVYPRECPLDKCGYNEEVVDCAKPKFCNTCEIRGNCKLEKCHRGCDCIGGYYRNKTGICIPASECPVQTCGEDETYNECGTACPLTCANRNDPPTICITVCVPGCFCDEGLVRNQDGECVEPDECPEETCPKNEVYSTCVNPCNDCFIKGKCQFLVCNKGCDCRKGYYRDINGKCIPESQCPIVPTLPPVCGEDEEFYECIPSCHRTCDALTRKIKDYCSQLCRSGCFCREGLYKRKDGKCVPPEQCFDAPDVCGVNEEYKECGTACPITCSNRNRPHKCIGKCVKGCFCKKGYIRNDNGRCVKPNECHKECGVNEEYKKCGTACPITCANRNKPHKCIEKCVKGCFCKKGYIRNGNGRCVKPNECPKDCGVNEEYKTCGTPCPITCANRNKPHKCIEKCVKGCFCKKGYIRNGNGRCVKPNECPKGCGVNEEYKTCGTACPITCSNRNKPHKCIEKCVKGCFCKKGYIRNGNGRCVKPNECPKDCGVNEEYKTCGTACPITCSNRNKPHKCIEKCVKGCFCKKGYIRNGNGRCVKPNECPKVHCKKDEQYYECVPSCKNNCKNYFNPGIRCGCAPPGCFCKEGLILREDGKCVPPEKCKNICGKKEQYYECNPSCKHTCENYNNPVIGCGCGPPGCFCKEGLVKRADGKCVKPEQCESETCDENETYAKCGSACPLTCANRHDPPVCSILPCVPGCFCDEGLVRNKDGECVEPEDCPKEICPKNEVYSTCVIPCNDCVIRGLCEFKKCNVGCDCRKGYYRDIYGKCIPESQCPALPTPPTDCGPDEEFYECIPACQRDCDVYTSEFEIACKQPCRSGCFCKEGLYKRKDGKCVPPEQCNPPTKPPKICGVNEVYKKCGTACPETCSNRGKPHICQGPCEEGCFCRDGYVRDNNGLCIEPSECPPEICGVDETYSDCGTACPLTCANMNDPPSSCITLCVPGCFCDEGLVRNQDGICVDPEDCPAVTCPKNEVYSTCVIPCNDCVIRGQCDFIICNEGCDCRKGYYRDIYGKCIPESQCPIVPTLPPVCGWDEEYYECIPSCQRTCEAYTSDVEIPCKPLCRSGCFCREGLYKRKDGKCVPPEQCKPTKPPGVCGVNEVYKECGTACPATCSNRDKPQICTDQCVEGCFCRDGFVRNGKGRCVKPRECPPKTCGKNEIYNECGTACPITCANMDKLPVCILPCVPGCFCVEGLVRNQVGECVKPEDCSKVTCPKNEVYSTCVIPCNDCVIRGQCDFIICNEGCDCRKGYYRDIYGKCIPESQCPIVQTCGEDETYNECGSACPVTCANRNDPPICIMQCVPGCFCNEGLIRNQDGKCVEPEDCPTESCPKNEVYSGCVNPCNDCWIRGQCEFIVCIEGCDCRKGYYRDIYGKCIPESQCPILPTSPTVCGPDEEFYECIPGCQRYCHIFTSDVKIACKQPCRSGCFCKEGLYKRKDGKCVPPEQCKRPTKPPAGICGLNEVYKTCGTACPATCSNRGKSPQVCTRQCVKGCFCRDGYVRNDAGRCVKPSKCPPIVCGVNEVYKKCGSECPAVCSKGGKSPKCQRPCNEGCFCRDGYVRENGLCVKCPPIESCGEGETYKECGSACPLTCANKNDPPVCIPKCVPGCFCNKGLVRNQDGACVEPEDCPEERCPKHEVYKKCVNPCNTCVFKGICPIILCTSGCDCKKGYFRHQNGRCIPESQCPSHSECGINEIYKECGTACPATCSNRDKAQACTEQCVKGCFCKEGYVRNDYGQCVEPEECPTGECGINEIYKTCGTACPATCSNRGKPQVCTKQCVKGCFCRDGYVRNDYGQCVNPDECPIGTCGEGEIYNECGSACPITCGNRHNPPICILLCVPGCFCKSGLLKDGTGKCVPESECPTEPTPTPACGENEQYHGCIPTCRDTCENYDDPHPKCTKICRRGCHCKNGFVKRRDGKCVRPYQCTLPTKPPHTCGANEQYYKCIPTCKNTCENYNDPHPKCPKHCRPGCYCKKGLVKRKDGKCVKPSQCTVPTKPPHTCGADEQYYKCIPTCKNTCENYNDPHPKCPKHCRPGCYCKKGLVKRKDGKCVKPSQCTVPTKPPGCGKNEVYYDECAPSCHGTCATYGKKGIPCPRCRPGCWCKKGLVKNKDGKCIPPKKCPTKPTKPTGVCGKDEVYYDDCAPSCQGTCETYGKVTHHCPRCRPGCWCKKGLVKNKAGKCIPPNKCPTTKPTKPPVVCGKDEVYYDECAPSCQGTCETYGNGTYNCPRCRPGCWCKKGLVKNKAGKCIPPNKCPTTNPTKPPHGTCGLNEEYYRCIPTCKHTCINFNATHPICSRVCRPGCFCKKGFVKRSDGKCVKPSDCKLPTKPPHEHCGKDEQYYGCVPTCKHTCENYNDPRPICPKYCRPGCYCKKGLVKRKDGKCVKPSQCTNPTKPPHDHCRKNEQHYDCVPTCKNTCENYDDPFCPPGYCRPGCYCKKGLVKRKDGKCVKPSQCTNPTKPPHEHCRKNEQHYDCVPTCKNTCENYDDPFCPPGLCIPGCYCKTGLVKRKDGKCVKPSQCTNPTKPSPVHCGKNEQHYECVPICKNTCENYDDPFCPRGLCRPGCYCKKGLVKRKDGKCVKPSQCTNPTKPPHEHCRKNEQHYDCVPTCKNTCENYDDPFCPPGLCRPGCYCKKGLVKRKDGKCVKPSQCTNPTKPPPCGKNEKYYKCVPTCKHTCENCDDPDICLPGPCRLGCYCKEGFVKRKDGKCVKPSQCTPPTGPPPPTCGEDEQHYACKPNCNNTCENYNKPNQVCLLICIPGCFCKEGLIKRKDGKCVKPSQCTSATKPPPKKCGKDEKYYKCVPTCKHTCENCEDPDICLPGLCHPGCFCKEGLVKRKDGKCVKPSQCTPTTKPPPEKCGRNEKYYKCVPTCKHTCENCEDPDICLPGPCRPGCFCKEGLVKRKDGKCVKPSRCTSPTEPPPKHCGKDEQYYGCVPTCKNTCENYNDPNPICPLYCRSGCFCKKGLVKRKDGKCVKPSQCKNPTKPPKGCGKNELYYDKCAPSCGGTCDTYGKKPLILCPICRPGCWCKKGLVKDEDGDCIPPDECPESTEPPKGCGKNELYYDKCAPSCGGTCDTYGKKPLILCPICRPGCWCKKGLVKDEDGDCIPPDECPESTEPPKGCGKNELYYDKCAPSCGGTCDTYGKKPLILCPICRPGCWCKKGLVKDEDGDCIPPDECPESTEPPPKKCDKDEKYYKCVPTCKHTCENCDGPDICLPGPCRPGCFCKEGLVKRKDGKCVKPSQCTPTKKLTCGRDEVYYDHCAPRCHGTCDTYNRHNIFCPLCLPGCWCKKGLVKNKNGKCIPPNKCPTTKPTVPTHHCPENQKFYSCIPSCKRTCMTYNSTGSYCPKECIKGCFCKEGLVMDKNGKCIPPEECPLSCGIKQQYYECMPDCTNRCNPPDACAAVCKKGCFCKEGLVLRERDNRCVRKEFCNHPEPDECGPDKEYYECYSTCGNTCASRRQKEKVACATVCQTGCFCKKGLLLDSKGNCVTPEECVGGGEWSSGESWSESWSESWGGSREKSLEESWEESWSESWGDSSGSSSKVDKSGSSSKEKKCGINEKFVKCAKPKWCNTCRIRGNCKLSKCRPGCDCKPNYYRNDKLVCIPEKKCPFGKCGINEIYKECGTACPTTCSNRDNPPVCKAKCVKGCFCKDGYVRNDHGQCVEPEKCPKGKCGINEIYKECGTACPTTCSNRDNPPVCKAKCVKGCFCKDGYVRNDHGQCVKPEKCPKGKCGINEIYKKCGTACPATCSNRDKPQDCSEKCIKGCFCKDGYVRNDHRQCVKPEKCPKEKCGINEKFVKCAKPKWCNTCRIRGNCKLSKCRPGCDCKPNYYRNDKLVCIPEKQCPSGKCGINEIYKECGTACPATCSNRDKIQVCTDNCVKGCFCKDGYVRNNYGQCVKPEKCPKGGGEWSSEESWSESWGGSREKSLEESWEESWSESWGDSSGSSSKVDKSGSSSKEKKCGINEKFVKCAKPKWCNTCRIRGNCKLSKCRPGCDCKPNYYRNDKLVCIPEKKCPFGKCGINETYKECGSACPATCSNRDKIQACSAHCVKGCFCKDGYVRNDHGHCVKPEKCPKGKCGINEIYKECGTACPTTCSNRDNPPVCKAKCVKGCFCKDGYVRNDHGQCVKPEKCPKGKCGINEIYKECGTACPTTCSNRDNPPVCKAKCVKGCFCKDGYVRNDHGQCVKPEKCPKGKCGKNEIYKECGTACPTTCSNRDNLPVCKAKCVKGCFCKDGYVRNDHGQCVKPEKCPKGKCGINEIYKECGTACPATCSNRDKIQVCTDNCVKGCFCKDGYVRNNYGQCVKPEKCPKGDHSCPLNEEFSRCTAHCQRNCDNWWKKNIICTKICKPGCVCIKGLVRGPRGICIRPELCSRSGSSHEHASDNSRESSSGGQSSSKGKDRTWIWDREENSFDRSGGEEVYFSEEWHSEKVSVKENASEESSETSWRSSSNEESSKWESFDETETSQESWEKEFTKESAAKKAD